MNSKRNYRIFLEITAILVCTIHLQWCGGTPNSVRISAIIPPPQVLLPPHREEGQLSLDDIIYFGGGSGVVATTPRSSLSSNSKSNSRNVNVAQTFLPPPAPPIPVPPRPHRFSTLVSASPPPSRNSASATSGEEIKVPQALKHRTPARKQYTKADLIAAANSLRPAGFDFNRVLVLNPSFFTNSSGTKRTNANQKSAGAVNAQAQAQPTQKNGHDLSQLYQHIMFPLPLFDTPVYNELKPLMEMLMRQGKFGKFSVGGGSGNDGKVLVILPKSMLNPSTASSATSVRSVPTKPKPTGNTKATTLQPRKFEHHTSASTPKPLFQKNFSTSRPIPSTRNTSGGNGGSAKVIIVPKGNRKISTTSKPKTKTSPATSGTSPTKRVTKLTSLPGKKVGKGPDLQVAATSNKLSQRPTGRKLPSSSSDSSDKRSYSFSKGGEKYSFSYAVKNDEFKDVKSHSESRDGDMVAGEYSMLEADGYTRVVRYTVDSDQGFKASVKRIPPS